MWKKCGLEGVIENEMTDRLADKLQYKNQIYPDDDWILTSPIKLFFYRKELNGVSKFGALLEKYNLAHVVKYDMSKI